MTVYRVTLADGQRFVMSGNFAQAAAPITVNFHDPRDENDWQVTPYQTADARHSPDRAAELLAEHFSTGDDDCTEVESVEEVAC
jgi:hypothetical protein